ncbi:MAG: hypothetical protein R3C01_02955 [Planctomycetaceae bacterium]
MTHATPTDRWSRNLVDADVVALSADWAMAVRQLWDLRQSEEISRPQWEAIIDWLVESRFDDKSHLAAETAASLIEDLAPDDLKRAVEIITGPPPLCELTFRRVTTT